MRLYGLPFAVLLGALGISGKVILILWKDNKALYEARIADLKADLDKTEIREEYYRDKWNQSLGVAEAQASTTRVLARRSQRD